jgi:hypothetical protein
MNDLSGKFIATFEIQKDGNKKFVDIAIEFNGTRQFYPSLAFESLRNKVGAGTKYLINVSSIPDDDWKAMKLLADYNDKVEVK